MITLEKKILPPLLPGFELAIVRSLVRRSTNTLCLLPCQGTLVHSRLSSLSHRGLILAQRNKTK